MACMVCNGLQSSAPAVELATTAKSEQQVFERAREQAERRVRWTWTGGWRGRFAVQALLIELIAGLAGWLAGWLAMICSLVQARLILAALYDT